MNEDKDFPLILGSALRYAMGRRSYIVGTTQDFIRRHWNELDTFGKRIITRDLKRFVDGGNKEERDEWIRESWVRLYNELSQPTEH